MAWVTPSHEFVLQVVLSLLSKFTPKTYLVVDEKIAAQKSKPTWQKKNKWRHLSSEKNPDCLGHRDYTVTLHVVARILLHYGNPS